MIKNHSPLPFDEAQDYLDQTANAIPADIFHNLNGGIVLLPKTVLSEQSLGQDLYILGQYHYDPYGMGRYISIYYGSFVKVYGNQPPETQKKKLKEVLYHELTHHLESMAGVRDLEIKDEIDLENYRKKYKQ